MILRTERIILTIDPDTFSKLNTGLWVEGCYGVIGSEVLGWVGLDLGICFTLAIIQFKYSLSVVIYNPLLSPNSFHNLVIIKMDKHKKVGEYIINLHDVKGQGAYSKVYTCKKEGSPKQYAVKIISRNQNNNKNYKQECAKREKQSMLVLKGQNVVHFEEYLQSNNSHYFIMQKCEGNLSDLMGGSAIPQEKAIQYLDQIVNGYQLLYENKIIHRDLKPENILYVGPILKIADFGISRTCTSDKPENYTFGLGTQGFMAPEISNRNYNYKVDIWSIGVIFYLMLHGTMPWKAHERYQIMNVPKIMESLSSLSKDFLRQSLKIHADKRMSFEEMIDHPIFKKTPLPKKQDAYAEELMKEIIGIVQSSQSASQKTRQSLDYYQTITNSLSQSQFEIFLKHICQFVDKTKAQVIFKFYKNQENQVPIPMLRRMFMNKSIQNKKKNQIKDLKKVKVLSQFFTI